MRDDLKQLREWLISCDGELALHRVEINNGFTTNSLHYFKTGKRDYLGEHEARVFEWAKKRGFQLKQQQNDNTRNSD